MRDYSAVRNERLNISRLIYSKQLLRAISPSHSSLPTQHTHTHTPHTHTHTHKPHKHTPHTHTTHTHTPYTHTQKHTHTHTYTDIYPRHSFFMINCKMDHSRGPSPRKNKANFTLQYFIVNSAPHLRSQPASVVSLPFAPGLSAVFCCPVNVSTCDGVIVIQGVLLDALVW